MAIHEAVEKADGVVFRCTWSGSAADRWLEVPAWMFDRARCLDPPRLTASPFVNMDALSVPSELLRQALKPPLSSSNEPHSGASRSSHDQNRGEAHDHAKPGATVFRKFAEMQTVRQVRFSCWIPPRRGDSSEEEVRSASRRARRSNRRSSGRRGLSRTPKDDDPGSVIQAGSRASVLSRCRIIKWSMPAWRLRPTATTISPHRGWNG